ncbi:hypothetical protein [Thiorhodococcus fuscus]|uniref:Uncharacterized protein n=1 Tax=Thiorhodococcus fuscus TaxID=527200 RepID=A0ABW4YDU7_9GAMM
MGDIQTRISPDFMPVEAPWQRLREDFAYHHCLASAEELAAHVSDCANAIDLRIPVQAEFGMPPFLGRKS